MDRGRRAAICATALTAAVGTVSLGASVAAASASSYPNDVAFRTHQQWGLVQAGFPAAWCRSTGAGALIVVIDTGIDAGHPDLAAKLVGQARVQNGALTTGAGAAADDSGHGTHVAGIAAAVTGNGIGIAAAAPDARLYAIKVLFAPAPGQPEQGAQSDMVQAIDYAADTLAPSWHGPVVLNISVGAADATTDSTGSGTVDGSGDISAAIDHAYARGLAIALAAGNNGTSPVGGAAVSRGDALSVGALDQGGAVAPYSPVSGVSIFAAGGSASGDHRYISTGIISTWPQSSAGDYAWMAGTSMAAPHVSAALAMLMSTGLSNQQAYARLLGTADAERRLHVDLALGNTTLCGAPPAPPRHGTAVPQHVVAPTTLPTVAPAPSAIATPAVTPRSAVAGLRAAAVPPGSGTLRPTSTRGSAWVMRGSLLGGGALLLAVLAAPRVRRRVLPRD